MSNPVWSPRHEQCRQFGERCRCGMHRLFGARACLLHTPLLRLASVCPRRGLTSPPPLPSTQTIHHWLSSPAQAPRHQPQGHLALTGPEPRPSLADAHASCCALFFWRSPSSRCSSLRAARCASNPHINTHRPSWPRHGCATAGYMDMGLLFAVSLSAFAACRSAHGCHVHCRSRKPGEGRSDCRRV